MGSDAWIIVGSLVANIVAWLVGYAVFIGKQSEKIKHIEQENILSRKKLDEISDRLSKLEGIREEQLVSRKSPLSLTDAGNKLLSESGAEAYLKDNKDKLFEHFTAGITKLDIQSKSREIIKEEIKKTNVDALNNIKEYAYNQGKDYEDLIDVMSIRLRDMFIEEKIDKKD